MIIMVIFETRKLFLQRRTINVCTKLAAIRRFKLWCPDERLTTFLPLQQRLVELCLVASDETLGLWRDSWLGLIPTLSYCKQHKHSCYSPRHSCRADNVVNCLIRTSKTKIILDPKHVKLFVKTPLKMTPLKLHCLNSDICCRRIFRFIVDNLFLTCGTVSLVFGYRGHI